MRTKSFNLLKLAASIFMFAIVGLFVSMFSGFITPGLADLSNGIPAPFGASWANLAGMWSGALLLLSGMLWMLHFIWRSDDW